MASSISSLSPCDIVLNPRILPMNWSPVGESRSRPLRTQSYFLDKKMLLRIFFDAPDSLD